MLALPTVPGIYLVVGMLDCVAFQSPPGTDVNVMRKSEELDDDEKLKTSTASSTEAKVQGFSK